jgi:hypothetical protein
MHIRCIQDQSILSHLCVDNADGIYKVMSVSQETWCRNWSQFQLQSSAQTMAHDADIHAAKAAMTSKRRYNEDHVHWLAPSTLKTA